MTRTLAITALLTVAATSFAAPPAQSSTPAGAASLSPADRRALMQQFRAVAEERDRALRERAAIFARIAVDHDYRGEYVLFRDDDWTAFLDLTDPRHPRYTPRSAAEMRPTGGDEPHVDPSLRAHILVVPNRPREHIGKTFTSDITAEDIAVVAKLMASAGAVAMRLGIKNPHIYVKSQEHVGVGYLHVHIVGEHAPGVSYPPPLE
jgi:diadenosine tetraphosphate (Ap4A) HIT family hydrolase